MRTICCCTICGLPARIRVLVEVGRCASVTSPSWCIFRSSIARRKRWPGKSSPTNPSRAPVIRNEVLLAFVSSAMAHDKADRAIPDLYVALFVARDVDVPRGNRMLLPLPLLLQRVDERDCGISKDLALEHHTQYKVYPH